MRSTYIKFRKICIKPPVIYWWSFFESARSNDVYTHMMRRRPHIDRVLGFYCCLQHFNWLQYFHESIALSHAFFLLFNVGHVISHEHNYYYERRLWFLRYIRIDRTMPICWDWSTSSLVTEENWTMLYIRTVLFTLSTCLTIVHFSFWHVGLSQMPGNFIKK